MADLQKNFVYVINGAGSEPRQVSWQEGDTRDKILKKANITLAKGYTASVEGRTLKRGSDKVAAGCTIVIAGKPYNGIDTVAAV